ncbi:MAG TPA: phosphopantetheine-binding protein [Trichormus sp.]|jgi:acyl carrier protein
MSIANGNSTAKGLPAASQSNQLQHSQARTEAGPSASAKASVMLEFQRTSLEMTCRFLQTQQRVMLAYLSGATDSVDGAPTMPPPLLPQIMAAPPVNVVRQAPVRQIEEKPQPPVYVEKVEKVAVPVTSNIAPAPIEPVTVTIEPAPVQSEVSAEHLISSLIEIISERTGYPPEMLDPTLDLEADLGIDSIKRVEVLNSFRKLLSADQQTALEDGIEELAGMKTLQSLTEWISNDLVPRISGNQIGSQSEFAPQASIGASDLCVR